jgi:hypothetical protein
MNHNTSSYETSRHGRCHCRPNHQSADVASMKKDVPVPGKSHILARSLTHFLSFFLIFTHVPVPEWGRNLENPFKTEDTPTPLLGK